MTQNQIDYAKLLETRRSNRAQEAQTALRDQRAYEVNVFNAQEAQRANRARESYNLSALAETHRANTAKESQARDELAEQTRYHTMNVGLGYAQLAENHRANKQREVETWRHNLRDESINADNAKTKAKEAAVKKQEADRKDAELELDKKKYRHQAIYDHLNYSLEARRVDLLEQHQGTVDPAYAASQYASAGYNDAKASQTRYNTGKQVVGDLAFVAVAAAGA